MFFKVSSIGSKRIDVMQAAFPSVPWIFVYRDPVQTMMSHMDPAKLKQIRGGVPQAVCLRAKRRPPNDLVELASHYGADIDELTNEEFCAAHLVGVLTILNCLFVCDLDELKPMSFALGY